MNLSNISKIKGNRSKGKRIGRGYASGKGGHTTTRGQKGTGARGSVRPGFEGGRTPLYRRVPLRRGLGNRIAGEKPEIVSLADLEVFKAGDVVSPQSLKEKGLISGHSKAGVKILGSGSVKKGLKVQGCKMSAAAKEALGIGE